MNHSTQALGHPRKNTSIGPQAPASPALSSSDESTAVDLEALWNAVKRHKWLVLFTCVLVTAVAGGITWMLPKVYQASAVVSVEQSPTARATIVGYAPFPELSAEIGILENSGELTRRVVAATKAAADTTDASFPLFARTQDGEVPDDYTVNSRLQAMMAFEADAEQGLITITAKSESPKEAAVVANVFAREYRQFSQEMARSGIAAARQFLQEQLEKRRGDIQVVESEWEVFARNNAVAIDGEDGQNVAREFADLQAQRDALVFRLEQEERTLAVLEDQLTTLQPNLRATVLAEQEVQSLRTQIQALETQIAELKTTAEQYYINDPGLRGDEQRVPELADIVRRITGFEARKADLTEGLVSATETGGLLGDGTTSIGQLGTQRARIEEQELTIGQLRAQIRALDKRLASYEGRLASIPRQTVQREQLNRRLAQAEQFHREIAMELQRTIVAEESELGYVTVMRAAVVPILPVSPNMTMNIVLGLLLGLGLGLSVAFVRQSTDWQIYEPDDIQARGYSLVGVIPEMDREIKKSFKGRETIDVDGTPMSTRLLPLLNPWSPITENYRLIRANLQFSAAQQNGNGRDTTKMIMVSSPEPGDGKTTTAVNLAITMALSGRSVLVIDADMRRPTAHKLLGTDKSPGLADVLTRDRALNQQAGHDVVQRTVVDGLYFMPAGHPEVPPTELLDSERMRTLLREAGDRFDTVILDTPPVLAATDALVLGTQCDTVLVVASADKTDFRALKQVEDTLSAVGVSLSGVIFNRYDAGRASGGYRYGYGYDYDYDTPPTA